MVRLIGQAAIVALFLSLAPGCALLAVKPETPADDMTVQQLEDAEPSPPNEKYYVLLFSSQSEPKRAKYTHSWSTIVRVVNQGPNAAPCVEHYTISWMPATLDIHPMRLRIEQGVNLDLHTTIREMLKNDERISLWGPYEVRPGIYKKHLMQKAFVESGELGYQCIDTLGEARRTGKGSDCIHAITDMDAQFDRGNYPLRRFGDKATAYIVEQVIERKAVINPECTHDWLLGPLGIADCPIVKRCYEGPKRPRKYRNQEQN